MESMSCQDVRRQVEETELDQYSCAADFYAHLSACQPCREFEAEHLALRQLVGSLGTVEAPADFDFRLRARLAASGGPTRRRHLLFGFMPAPGARAIALAALFAVLVAGAAIFKHAQRGMAYDAFEPQANAAPEQNAKTSANEQQLASKREPEGPKDKMLASLDVREKAPGHVLTGARRRARADVRSGGERGVGPTAAAAASLAAGPKRDSVEFSSRTAPVISLFEVHVPEANQPMKVSLEDRRGKTRTLSVQRVTFGSQELVEQPGAQRAPLQSSKGVW